MQSVAFNWINEYQQLPVAKTLQYYYALTAIRKHFHFHKISPKELNCRNFREYAAIRRWHQTFLWWLEVTSFETKWVCQVKLPTRAIWQASDPKDVVSWFYIVSHVTSSKVFFLAHCNICCCTAFHSFFFQCILCSALLLHFLSESQTVHRAEKKCILLPSQKANYQKIIQSCSQDRSIISLSPWDWIYLRNFTFHWFI